MGKKFNIEFGIHIDPKLQHLLSVAFHKLELNQELRFFILELLQELQFPMFQTLLDQLVLYMQFNFLIELVEILLIWRKNEPMLSP